MKVNNKMHIKYAYKKISKRSVSYRYTTYTLDIEREKYFNKPIPSLQTNRNNN